MRPSTWCRRKRRDATRTKPPILHERDASLRNPRPAAAFARRIHTRRRSTPTSAHSVALGSTGDRCRVGIDTDGRERLAFIPGDVATPPYPAWAQTDIALGSIARLIRRLHDASVGLDLGATTWSDEMADPLGGEVMCHNDVCLENVVFRNGEAIALLDFDFAAPGRREFDLAAFARMCVDPELA